MKKWKSNEEILAESEYTLCLTCNVGVYRRGSLENEDGSQHVCRNRTIYTVPLHVGQNIEVPRGSIVSFYDPDREQPTLFKSYENIGNEDLGL